MRIAFFVDQFPSLSETFILNQITGLIDRGHEVDIFGDKPGNTTQMHPEVLEYRLLDRTYYRPIPYHLWWRCLKGLFLVLGNFYKAPQLILRTLKFWQYDRSRYGNLAAWFSPLYLLLPLLGRDPYDIIHCHYGRNGLKAVLLKDLGAIDGKIVTAFHGYDISRYLQLYGDDVYNYLFQRGDLLQPISKFWYHKLVALGCSPEQIAIQVHHMGIDGDRLTPATATKDNSDKIVIVSVARLVEKKGLAYGISAVAQLIAQHPQLKLEYQIIGDGILRSVLEQQIEQLGVSQQVKLLGWKQQQEVQEIVSQADLVLAPSITSPEGDCEGIPVSLMEAMALGIPIVSTYHSGIPELVEDGVTGYLVPETAVDALTEKLAYLLNHPEIGVTMGQAGRDKVLREYNIQLLCDRLVATYQELLT